MEKFKLKHDVFKHLYKIPKENLEKHSNSLSKEAFTFLESFGVSSFSSALFYSVDPTSTKELLKDWNPNWETCSPMIRSAFGSIFYFQNKKIWQLDPVFQVQKQLPMDTNIFLNVFLCNDAFLNSAFYKDIFDQVVDKLSPPAIDEVYAFVPALALGGSKTPESVQKVKLKEHLLLLSQLK